MSSKSVSEIFKIVFQTRDINLQRCWSQELFQSQIPVTTGGFELRISCKQSNYLTH